MRTSLVVAASAFLLPMGVFADDAPKPSPSKPAAAAQPAPTTPATAPPQPAPPAPSDPATAATATTDANGSYTVRLHDLERRVNELKEQIFRSKARLNLLKETVLHGVIAGSRAVITHRNEMGTMYTPIRYVYALDGQEIYSKSDDSGKLGDQKEIEDRKSVV